jgi:hypothetical protein
MEYFKVGDIVTAFGNKGVVVSLSKDGSFVNVKFKECEFSSVVFNSDGKLFRWNKKPALKKVKNERAIKK